MRSRCGCMFAHRVPRRPSSSRHWLAPPTPLPTVPPALSCCRQPGTESLSSWTPWGCPIVGADHHPALQRGDLPSLARRFGPGKPCRLDAACRQALVELPNRPPADFGIESRLWTAVDLARVAREQGLAEQLSPDTGRAEIQRPGKSWQRAKRWTDSPHPDYSRKRGASGRYRRRRLPIPRGDWSMSMKDGSASSGKPAS